MKRTFWPSSVTNMPFLVVLVVFIFGGTGGGCKVSLRLLPRNEPKFVPSEQPIGSGVSERFLVKNSLNLDSPRWTKIDYPH